MTGEVGLGYRVMLDVMLYTNVPGGLWECG